MTVNLRKSNTMTGRTLIPFLVLAFGLTWGIATLLILYTDQIAAIFGEIDLEQPAGHPGYLFARHCRSGSWCGGIMAWKVWSVSFGA